jgi:Na+/H+ antiporter NhaD/arsenite permease-like protein
MVIVAGLKGQNVLDIIARGLMRRCGNMRSLVLVLTGVCFAGSMLITNDVALITFVPLAVGVLTLSGGERYIIYTVVLQTVAANMGSMLTPMGNPQNLYLADFYNMSAGEFVKATAPVSLLSAIVLLVMQLYIKKDSINKIEGDTLSVSDKRLALMYAVLGVIALLAVFNITTHFYAFATVITAVAVLMLDRNVLKRVDYSLLLTFVMFFIFVGNAARIEAVRTLLGTLTTGREVLVGAIASQVISNVPSAVMLSSFTDNGTALLRGVGIGGLGTPVASLASLISLRLYSACEGSNKGKYLAVFTVVNFGLLILLLVIFG